jgi:hypothetical protein
VLEYGAFPAISGFTDPGQINDAVQKAGFLIYLKLVN